MVIKMCLTRLNKARYTYIHMYILFHENQRLTIDLNERDRVSSVSQFFNLILNLTQFYIKDIKNIEFFNLFKFTWSNFLAFIAICKKKKEKYVFVKRLLLAVVRWNYGKFHFTIKHCLRSHRLSLWFLFTSHILLFTYLFYLHTPRANRTNILSLNYFLKFIVHHGLTQESCLLACFSILTHSPP